MDLSKYKQLAFIGNGTFGEVYKLEDIETGEVFAAKISFRYLSDSSEKDNRDLKREVDILSSTHHPSILRFIGFSPCNFHGEAKPVIITEYMSNGSLYDILELEKRGLCKEEWNDTRKLICIYGIAAAMSYLHEHNIIHRDLKPANILMDDFLSPKIADFGLSKINHQNEESLTGKSTTMIKGSGLYISPEILTDFLYTPACDVYAFGIIVYEIITSEEPWKGLNLLQIHKNVDAGLRPEINSCVPKSYQILIKRCWEQKPEKRPTFNEILEYLRNDNGFITDMVEKEDYLDYIDFIEDSKATFGKNPIQIDHYIKRKSSTFTKISLNSKSATSKSAKDPAKSSKKMTRTKSMPDLNVKTEKKRRSSLFKRHKSKVLYPTPELKHLDQSSRDFVEEAAGDPEKEFIIGQNLIEGKENFPQNAEIAILYLEHSVKKGCFEAAIFYCRLLIKGNIIPRDIQKASKLIKKFKKTEKNNGTVLYLH